jgi:hypothetical protein
MLEDACDEALPLIGDLRLYVCRQYSISGDLAADAAAASEAAGLSQTPVGYVWHRVDDGTRM